MGEVIDEEIDEVVDAESPLEEISQALTRSYEPEALVQNAQFVVKTSMDIRRGENVLIVCDPTTSEIGQALHQACLLYTSPSPRDRTRSRMPSSA